MERRRLDLGLTWREAAEAGSISYEVIRAIRNGNGQIRPLSKRGIEVGLHWEGGSVDRILAGGDPVPVEAIPPPQSGLARVSSNLDEGMQPHLDDVNARIGEAASRGTPVERLTGKDLFPGLPWDEANWDQLRGFGYSVPQVAQFIAVLRYDEAERARNQPNRGSAAGLTASKVT